MTARLLTMSAAALLAACGGPAEPRVEVLIGATLINSGGKPPTERSVVIVEDGRIKAVGDQPTLPIPAGSAKTDLSGRFLVPAPVEASKDPKWPKFSTQEEFLRHVNAGVPAAEGMILDTESLDAALLRQAAGSGMIVVPKLVRLESAPLERNIARRNLKAFADAGISLAIDGSLSADREWKLFAEAGIPPAAIIDASTRLMAKAAKLRETGEVAPGFQADLYVLRCNPLQDVSCLTKVERAMAQGRWVTAPARGEN